MSSTPRVGLIGTLVHDVIYGPPPRHERSEGWGGVAYTLHGMAAATHGDWEIVPLIKVGADVARAARDLLASVPHVVRTTPLHVVPEQNNRSELRYFSAGERTECASGGVPGWEWEPLKTALDAAAVDALYVNFLSGVELDLPTMQQVRDHFRGLIYVDLHMLLWHTDATGHRTLRPLMDVEDWCRCFDYIQVNEEEMRTIAPDPVALARIATSAGACGVIVTRGTHGVHILTRDESAHGLTEAVLASDTVHQGERVDPTGCGDVWGGTFFVRMLAGDPLPRAARDANRAAGINALSSGVVGLVEKLRASA
ncbi:MAG TPA: carbohydrate kinase family protein [Gemmatimonas sp.]|nr:carbohydrate kinase family protein [Gemmatimonas sp.]